MKIFFEKALKLGLVYPLDVHFATMLYSHVTTNCNNTKHKKMLILASACLSASIRIGNVCLSIHDLTSDKLFHKNYPELTYEVNQSLGYLSITHWNKLLLSYPKIISDGSFISPLVIENERLYLYRMWKEECIVSKFFQHSSSYIPNASQKFKIIKILNDLFPHSFTQTIDWIKVATTLSLTEQKILISGGPGTGKTSTITKIIALLLLINNKLKIRMVTPTGKSATLLTEYFNSQIHDIKKLINYEKNIFPIQATTIHKLINPYLYIKNNMLLYNNNSEYSILNIDVLIIDEASMISLSILAKLILLIQRNTKVILLGDHNQLCSIEPGSVFKDICQFASFGYSTKHLKKLSDLTGYTFPLLLSTQNIHYKISNNICILKKNYRFSENSGINKLSMLINSGNSNHTISLLNSNLYSDINYFSIKTEKDYMNMIINSTKKYCNFFQTLKNNHFKIKNDIFLKFFNYYCILCALNDGFFGTIYINNFIENILHQKGLIQLHTSGNYIGRPIIILKNAPSLKLSNGDIGILLLNSEEKLAAYFFCPKQEIKTIQIYQLPKYETCFAITIHKSQGSEFQYVSIILPNQHVPILTRELLYTAVTRTRLQLNLYATNHIITHSIRLTTQRNSGLYEKLKKIK